MSIYVKIKKSLGNFNLDVEFEAENEVLALLGSSGCGKSMTLKCIAGVMKPDEGVIEADGITLYNSKKGICLPPQKRNMGYLFQNYALFPNMTVERNIKTVLRLRGAENEFDTLMNSFYIKGLEEHYPSQLSRGQQQRVALARMLASCPKVIMLDEPLSALDSYLRWQLEDELTKHLENFDGTTLYVSHNRDEVFRMCGKVCVIHRGKSEPLRLVRELFEAPGTLASSRLSGCKNHSAAKKLSDNSIEALSWKCVLLCSENASDKARYVGVRAHSIKPYMRDGANNIDGTVISVAEDLFSSCVIFIPEGVGDEISDKSFIRIECSKEEANGIKEGDKITVSIDPADIMVLL